MAKIVCTKCGLTGFSKCPYCRSVFVDSSDLELAGADEILSYYSTFTEEDDGRGKQRKVIKFYNLTDDMFEDTYVAILERIKRILNKTDRLDVLGCVHHWTFAPGEKSAIRCGHDETV